MNKRTKQLQVVPAEIGSAAAAWLARRDAGLTADEEARFATWLEQDPRHRAAWGELGAAWLSFDRERLGHDADLMVIELSARRRRRQRRWKAALGGAGALAAALVFIFRPAPPPMADRVAGTEAHETPHAIPSRQLLADGSVVELNLGAEIAVNYSAGRRSVSLLRGEAHFEVAKDSARPFVVSAGAVRVRAVGTAFVVRMESQAVDVVVTEGKVAIQREAPAGAPPALAAGGPILGAAGDRVIVPLVPHATDSGRVEVLPPAEIERRLAWRGHRIEFSGTSLAEAVTAFNRKNRVQVSIGDAELAALRLSGVFRADNVDGFVRLLSTHYGIAAESPERDRIVLRRAK